LSRVAGLKRPRGAANINRTGSRKGTAILATDSQPGLADEPTRYADRAGARAIASKPKAQRKSNGLYLTSPRVAAFMAAQVNLCQAFVRILDPAAGSGTLLCAIVERLASIGGRLREMELTAYEIDPDLRAALMAVLENLKRWAATRRITINFRIEGRDFLLAHAHALGTTGDLFIPAAAKPFDLVIANPPYFKISKSDPRARSAATVVHGQPNIYALFMAAGAGLLRDGGHFLFIIPRSFTSGPYFRLFREKFFEAVRPTGVHVFGSRRDAFERDEVLQENIILRGVRESGWQSHDGRSQLEISTSKGTADLDEPVRRSLSLGEAFCRSRNDRVLRLPILKVEDDAVGLVESWTGSLHQYGMNISTGPVVPFRATEFLSEVGNPSESHLPLLWMSHVHAMEVSFPTGLRKPQYIDRRAGEKSLLLPNRNYVLLRRFSAKEEARRLVAAPWLKRARPYPLLGIENHLNYIHRPGGELDEDEAFGLAAVLNSELLDTYFRVSSGNTQVSATELRAMPLPPYDKIKLIGRRVKALKAQHVGLEEIVREAISPSQ
jgi:adenine-specific DNA-methyltransferase